MQKFSIKKLSLLLIGILILLSEYSCQNPVTQPPNNAKASITVEDVSCTEAWIRLNTEGVSFAREAKAELYRDDSLTQTVILQSKDTLFYEDGLLPSKTYRYKVKLTYVPLQGNEQQTIITAEKEAVTLDTTSHEFTWQTYTFGGANGSSYLMDVAIINENDIWAVGEIHTEDTDQWNEDSTEWVQPYNAVHWNGEEWELKRILFHTFCSYGLLYPYPARSIFYLDDSTLVASSGSEITYIKNGVQQKNECVPVSINAMWGESSNDFYVVGNGGNIAHYNGSSWTKINSGTELSLKDIYGIGNEEVYVCGEDCSKETGILIKGSKGNKWETMITSGLISEDKLFEMLYGELSTVWIDERGQIHIGGVFLYRYSHKRWGFEDTFPNNYLWGNPGEYRSYIVSIRGNASNDWTFCGPFNTLYHFNGVSWKELGEGYDKSDWTFWNSVRQKGDIIVAVGDKLSDAKIIVLKR